jgi:hypothetical protein
MNDTRLVCWWIYNNRVRYLQYAVLICVCPPEVIAEDIDLIVDFVPIEGVKTLQARGGLVYA